MSLALFRYRQNSQHPRKEIKSTMLKTWKPRVLSRVLHFNDGSVTAEEEGLGVKEMYHQHAVNLEANASRSLLPFPWMHPYVYSLSIALHLKSEIYKWKTISVIIFLPSRIQLGGKTLYHSSRLEAIFTNHSRAVLAVTILLCSSIARNEWLQPEARR